jgi:hypothetical protein
VSFIKKLFQRPSSIAFCHALQVVPDLEVFQKQNQNESSTIIELPIPRCIHAHYSPAGGTEDSPVPPESFLVLENLGPKGFEGAEFSQGLSLQQAEAALTAIAKVHALSLTLKVKEGKPLSERYPFLFQTARATDSYQQLGKIRVSFPGFSLSNAQ